MNRAGLKTKLLVSSLLLVFVGLLINEVVTYRKTSEIVHRLVQTDLQNQLKSVELAIEISRSEDKQRITELSKNMGKELLLNLGVSKSRVTTRTIVNQETQEKVEAEVPQLLFEGKPLSDHNLVDKIAVQTSSATTLFVVVPQGLLRVSTTVKKGDGSRALDTFIPKTSPVYKTVLAGQDYFGRAKVVGKWYTTAYLPIKQDGEVVGVYFMGVPETSTEKIAAYLKQQRLLATGYFYILDSKGNFLMHPSLEGQNVLERTDLDGRSIFKEILEAKSGKIEYRWLNAETQKAQDKIAYFKTFPEIDWTVAASLNAEEALAEVNGLAELMLVISVLVLTVMATLTWFFTSWIVKDFVVLGERLKQVLAQISSGSEKVLASSGELETSSSSQAEAVQETAATLEEVRSIIGSNLQMTLRSEQLSNQTEQSANDSCELMKTLTSTIENVKQGNDDALNRVTLSYNEIRDISQVLKSIDAKTGVINDIVFQTKLLSFNASVEAARAGEHGKGFAVVAEEVGKLAAMTGAAALEINETMKKSMTNVNDLIKNSEDSVLESFREVSKRVQSTVDLSLKTAGALNEILNRAQETNSNMKDIAVASREQTTAVEQIAMAVNQIDQGVQQTATSAKNANAISNALNEQVKALDEINVRIQEILNGRKSALLAPRAEAPASESEIRRAA